MNYYELSFTIEDEEGYRRDVTGLTLWAKLVLILLKRPKRVLTPISLLMFLVRRDLLQL